MRKRICLILGGLFISSLLIILVNYYATLSNIAYNNSIRVEKYEWLTRESLIENLNTDHHFRSIDIYYGNSILLDENENFLVEDLFEYDSVKGLKFKNDVEFTVVYRDLFYKKELIVEIQVIDSIYPEIIVKSNQESLKEGDIVKITDNDTLSKILLINSFDKCGDKEKPVEYLSSLNLNEPLKAGNYELIVSASDDAGNATSLTLGVVVEKTVKITENISKNEKKELPISNEKVSSEKTEDRSKQVNIVGKDLHSVEILVNKKNGLPSDFVPSLTTIPSDYAVSEGYRATPDTTNAFISLVDSMYNETGLWVYVTSSYRSYSFQNELYNSYVNANGQEAADRFSAKPGLSEHQTGLAIDMVAPNVSMWNFAETEQSKWVRDNAHRFGFILRYLPGKETITGYMHEPWHIRFIGVDLAKKIYQSGLTYEEFLSN